MLKKGNPMVEALLADDEALYTEIKRIVRDQLGQPPRGKKKQLQWRHLAEEVITTEILELIQERDRDHATREVNQRLIVMHEILAEDHGLLRKIVKELQSIPPDPAVLRRNRVVV